MALKNYENQRVELPVSQRTAQDHEGSFEVMQVAISELAAIIFHWFKSFIPGRRRQRKDTRSIGFSRPTGNRGDPGKVMDSKLGVARYNKSIENANATHRK